MITFKEKTDQFIALKRFAVTGVSSEKPDAANLIFNKLKKLGVEVFPVNPKVKEVENAACYPNLTSLPQVPEGVVIGSPPASVKPIIEECIKLGIKHVWLHRAIGNGSYDAASAKFAEENGISVIPSGCPMMYFAPVDFGHQCMKWIFRMTGKIPK